MGDHYLVIKTHIIRNKYRDSVQLMRAASIAGKLSGVELVSVLMGTPKNKLLLEEANLLTPEARDAESNDIIISVRAESETYADDAIIHIINFLEKDSISIHKGEKIYRSLRNALTEIPEANLAVISVPGEFAAREARVALEKNLNVLLFSDNVSIDDEIALKRIAHDRGLIVMGPDCGTAMIKNIGLGFANVVNPGPIGIIAASGTGTQEVMTLCHHQGVGVTHAIGTGSRDIKDIIEGISMIDGLHALDQDKSVKIIVIISKPPDREPMNNILDKVKDCSKPVIINFLGKKAGYFDYPEKSLTANTLEEAAYSAANYIKNGKLKLSEITFNDAEKVRKILNQSKTLLKPNQKYIRGLYAGGTFTFEAAMIISKMLSLDESLFTNVKLKGTKLIENPKLSKEHTLIDMGADEFTIGKPHPMIDQTERTQRFLEELEDPQTAVIILDFVLGYGAHPNPVEDMREAFSKWRSIEQRIPIVTHICGTDLDPQDYDNSVQMLEEMGIYAMPTNAQAAKLASLIATRGNIS